MKRFWEEEAQLIMTVAFESYGRPLETVTAFK